MKASLAMGLCAACIGVAAQPDPSAGYAIKRIANMPDGAPAFAIVDPRGERIGRIECIFNGWYDSDAMAARLLRAPGVMAAIIAKRGGIVLEDLGPAYFDCVVVPGAALKTP